jgi:hypothetical protein
MSGRVLTWARRMMQLTARTPGRQIKREGSQAWSTRERGLELGNALL